MSRAARTRRAAIRRSRTTPALWADPVMGSWRRHDPALVSAAGNPAHHYEGRLRRAISLSDGWNAPRRRCGGTIDSMASSFSVVSGRQRGMTQPERYLPDVLRCLQDDHRACVPQHVGRDAFLVEAGMRSSGGRCMLFEQIGEAPSAQRLSPGVDEHLGCCDPPANGEPGAQGCGRGLPQGERPFPPCHPITGPEHVQQKIPFIRSPRLRVVGDAQGHRGRVPLRSWH